MPMLRPSSAAAAIFALSVLGLASCGQDNPAGLPDVARARIVVTVDPTPVAGVQSLLDGSISAAYTVTLTEINGLGGEVAFVSSTVFDPESGLQAAVNYFDASDLAVFVGTSRIEPGGAISVPLTVNYILTDLRKEADMTVAVQFRDDRGSIINTSLLVKIV
jgi:hypothetical protein